MPPVPSSKAIPPPGPRLRVSTGTGAQSHPPAHGMCSNPPPQVVQELLWPQGLFRHGHSGTERKSKRGRTPWSHHDDSCSPLGREQILKESSAASNLLQPPPFPQGITKLLHFYIQPERRTEERFCASSWLVECPLRQLGASPACSSPGASCWQCHACQDTREFQENSVFLKKNTEAALLKPSFPPISTGMWS